MWMHKTFSFYCTMYNHRRIIRKSIYNVNDMWYIQDATYKYIITIGRFKEYLHSLKNH